MAGATRCVALVAVLLATAASWAQPIQRGRSLAERSLPLIESVRDLGRWLGRDTTGMAAAQLLLMGPEGHEALYQAEKSEDPAIRAQALWAISQLDGQRALMTLVRAYGSRPFRVRDAAYHGLFAKPDGVLLNLLWHGAPEAQDVAWSVGSRRWLHEAQDVNLVLGFLQHPREEIRMHVLTALQGLVAHDPVFGVALERLADPSPLVRRHAVSLSVNGSVASEGRRAEAVPRIIAAFSDDDLRVRQAVTRGLGVLVLYMRVAESLRPDLVRVIVSALSDPDENVAAAALPGIQHITLHGVPIREQVAIRRNSGNAKTINMVRELVYSDSTRRAVYRFTHSDNENVRFNALLALGGLRDERAIDPLLKYIGTQRQELALTAIGATGSRQAAEELISLLPAVVHQGSRFQIGAAIAKTGDPRAVSIVIRLLDEALDHQETTTLVKALEYVRTREAFEALRTIAFDPAMPDRPRSAAIYVLPSFPDEGLPIVKRILLDDGADTSLRISAAGGLRMYGGVEDIEILEKVLVRVDGEVREWVERAIETLRTETR